MQKKNVEKIGDKLRSTKNLFFEKLLDILFPKFCFGCGKEGEFVCKECLKKIKKEELRCPYCQKINFSGEFCRSHKRYSHLDGLIFFTFLGTGSNKKKSDIQRMIYGFKYEGIKELGKYIGGFMASALRKHFIFKERKNIVLCPLPLFFLKKLNRGFNQSEILANHIGTIMNVDVKKLIFRIKNTRPQALLSKKEREENVKNSFVLNSKIDAKDIKGKIVVLIDDVYTTGFTLSAAAGQIKKLKPKQIWGLVFAKEMIGEALAQ